MAFDGAVVKKSADQTSANYSSPTILSFDAEHYDLNSWHDNTTNNTRLTVPVGVTRIRLIGQIYTSLAASQTLSTIEFLKNGAVIGTPDVIANGQVQGASIAHYHESPVLDVTAGDYFELRYTVGDTSITVEEEGTYFAIEKVEFPQPAYSGAWVKKSADQTTADYTAPTYMAFDAEVNDVGGWHDNVTNNSRLTVPAGVSYVRLKAQVGVSLVSSGQWKDIWFFKNNAVTAPRLRHYSSRAGSTSQNQICSPVLPVTPGDYFQLSFQVLSDASITIVANETWFSIEDAGADAPVGPPLAAPVNTVLPVISGGSSPPESGETLSISNGTWLNSPTSYTYQWFSADPLTDGGVLVTYNGEPIYVGAKTNLGTASTQLLGAPHVGLLIGCEVTATNAVGSAVAESEVVGEVV